MPNSTNNSSNNLGKDLALLCVGLLFISTTGVLARSIQWSAVHIIGWRSIVAALFLILFCKWKGLSLQLDKKGFWLNLIGGILLGLHWVTYFISLKLSSVAVGMLSLFTFPTITALLEPWILKTRFSIFHLFLGVLVIFGIYFLAPDLNFENQQFQAVLFGVFSALCFSIRNILMKKQVTRFQGTVLMTRQLIVVGVLLLPYLLWNFEKPTFNDISGILTLALLATAIGHTLFAFSLKKFSATTTSIIGGLQPIFGILLGYLFLKETLVWNTFVGGSLILLTVILESYRIFRSNRKSN